MPFRSVGDGYTASMVLRNGHGTFESATKTAIHNPWLYSVAVFDGPDEAAREVGGGASAGPSIPAPRRGPWGERSFLPGLCRWPVADLSRPEAALTRSGRQGTTRIRLPKPKLP